MGRGSDLFAQQQQAKQLRAIERSTAAAAGESARPLGWIERNVLGVKDPKHSAPHPRAESDAARIAQLEAQVAALEARMKWSVDWIQELQARTDPT
jgi:hypothetical protein